MSNRLEDWRGLDIYTLAEAALLIIEEYPDDWTDSEGLLKNPPHRFIPIYKKLRTSATNVIDENAPSEEDPNHTYIKYDLHTDKAENVERISKVDGFSVNVGQGQLKKWINAKGIQARFFTDDNLAEFKANEKEDFTPTSYANPTNKDSTTYPPELDIALQAWQAVSTIEKKGKPKARIKEWLDANTKLSDEAKERISIVANWNKTGGATRTD